MATYEYRCEACKKSFTLIQKISEHGKTKVTCPKCKSEKVKQQISSFLIKTSRKS
ncbi:MAG: zinc ribbon domain-containing protein [Pseudomonadota bacterium]|nr:zinc ribbon domain-containing protein [Pseudomonadota bacterium]